MGKNKGEKKGKVLREEEEEEESEEEEREQEENEEEEDEEGGVLLDLDQLPRYVRNRVHAMKKLQEDADAIDDEYKQERMALERKYIARRQAIYDHRRQIISGDVEVPDVPEEGEEPAAAAEEEEPVKGIPEFWNTVLSVHPAINEYIVEEDMPALSKLTDITCNTAEDFTSFTLSFHFAENEYFSNAVLTKKYEVMPDLLDDQSPTLKSTEGSEIQWKAGKNLCEEETTKKQRAKSGRNKGQVRTITVKKPKRSFFHFFSPMSNHVSAEEEEDDEEGPKDNEPVDKDGNPVKIDPESDYDIGHVIRTSLIPQAINWFTGEAALEYDAMFGYDDEDEDEEGEDEEDDEDEDEEEEEEAPKGKKSQSKAAPGKKGKGSAAPGGEEKPAECKQN